MNSIREAKKTRDQGQSVGARRLRRFTARMVLGVCRSQTWWTLKRPEGRAPFASRSDAPTVAVGFISRLDAPHALRHGATHEFGPAFSTVARRRRIAWRIEPWFESHYLFSVLRSAGFIPQEPEKFQSTNTLRRLQPSCGLKSALRALNRPESHGYHHQVAPRLQKRPGKKSQSES